MWALFGTFLVVLATVTIWKGAPAFVRWVGIGTYLGAMLAASVGALANGAEGLLSMFNPMKHAFPHNMEGILSDYTLATDLAQAPYGDPLPEIASALKEEADDVEARRVAVFGMLDKIGVWPMLMGGIAGAGQLGKGVAWPGSAAIVFILFVGNMSLLNFSKTLRRYASVLERAQRILDVPAPRAESAE
jgi:hypothetical protein